jgi:hypothetical protein
LGLVLTASAGHLTQTTRPSRARDHRGEVSLRPQRPGAYVGVGSRIWAWLLLERLAPDHVPDAVERAVAFGDLMPAAVAADGMFDIIGGTAGAIPGIWPASAAVLAWPAGWTGRE